MRPHLLQCCDTGAPIALASVDVAATIVDSFARVTLTQAFVNDTPNALEALYTFPLDEQGAVSAFEAAIDGRIVCGRVMERQTAAEAYAEAIRSGHGAYLASEDRADVFTISVGNLPSGAAVSVRLTYLTKLKAEGDDLRFTLPATIGERFSPGLGPLPLPHPHLHPIPNPNPTPTPTPNPNANPTPTPTPNPILSGRGRAGDSSDAAVMAPAASESVRHPIRVRLALEMTAPLRSVTSPTHPISFELGERPGAGVVTLGRDEAMDAEAVFVIATGDPHRPTACCEVREDAAAATTAATAMVSFFPTFDAAESRGAGTEIVFVTDRSGSMAGSKMEQCKNALHVFLRSLPAGTGVNIVSFGSSHSMLFPDGGRALDDQVLDTAVRYVDQMEANMGGTDILAPLEAILRQDAPSSRPFSSRQIIVLTDGQVSNTQSVLETVARAAGAGAHRFFSLGLGNGASHELVAGIARRGLGAAEFVVPGERLEGKVARQLRRALQPSLAQVTVSWHRDGREIEAANCPREIPPVFAGDRLTVFAALPRGAAPPDAVRISGGAAGSDGHAIDVTIAIPPDAVRPGELLAKFAARESIRYLQETGGDSAREEITRIALAHGLASRHTSFVAVEEREDTDTVDPSDMKTVVVPQCVSRDARRVRDPDADLSAIMASIAKIQAEQAVCLDEIMDRSESIECLSTQMDSPQWRANTFNAQAKCFKKRSAFFGAGVSLPSIDTSGVSRAFRAASRSLGSLLSSPLRLFKSAPSPATTTPFEATATAATDIDKDMMDKGMDNDAAAASLFAEDAGEAAGHRATRQNRTQDMAGSDDDDVNQGNRNGNGEDDYIAIIKLQRADGHWEASAKLAKALGVATQDLTDAVAATTAAIHTLRTRFQDRSEEWSLLVDKASSWLASRNADIAPPSPSLSMSPVTA